MTRIVRVWNVSLLSALALVLITLAADLSSAQDPQPASIGQLWASDSLAKVLRSTTPNADTDEGGTVRMSGSRGEIVSGQAVFQPAAHVIEVAASIGDLRHHDSGVTILIPRMASVKTCP